MALQQQNGRVECTDRKEFGFCGTKVQGDETLSSFTAYNR